MQLGGRTRRKTTAAGVHLLEAGSLTGFAHGDRTGVTCKEAGSLTGFAHGDRTKRPKCKEFFLVTGLQAVSALQV